MAKLKTKTKKQPELVEPVDVNLSASDWRHLARVLVYSGKAAPGMRDQLVTFAAKAMKACEGKQDTENVAMRDARTAWCNLTTSLLKTSLCLHIGIKITEQIPV